MEKVSNVKEKKTSKTDVENGKVMAVLSYLGILCLIPFFTEKKNKFVIFHAKQGINLFITNAIFNMASRIITSVINFKFLGFSITDVLSYVFSLCSLVFVILSIIGIVYVFQGKIEDLPIVNKFKFIK